MPYIHLCESCTHGEVEVVEGVKKYTKYPYFFEFVTTLSTYCRLGGGYKRKRLIVTQCQHYELKPNFPRTYKNGKRKKKEMQTTLSK